jgi:hypothetical protein
MSRLLNTDKHCNIRHIVNYWCEKTGLDLRSIAKCNFKTSKVLPVINKLPEFYQEVLLAYNKCKTIRPTIDITPYEVVTDILWGNERFKHEGKCLWFRSWIDSGILYVKDILDVDGKILKPDAIINKLKCTQNWISEYSIVKKACKIVEKLSTKLAKTNVKIRDRSHILYVKDKHHDVLEKKSRFYYDILRNQIFKMSYMHMVWRKELDLDCLEFQTTWQNIYCTRIKQMPITKLAEFNYKLLAGVLPCGYSLSKWKSDIPPNCVICNVKEDVKHMLYECPKICDIWKNIGQMLCISIQWKHIVLGYFQQQNETTKRLNCLFSLIAYSIFKANNACKWENLEYLHYNVKRRVINDVKLFVAIQKYLTDTYIPDQILDDILESMLEMAMLYLKLLYRSIEES